MRGPASTDTLPAGTSLQMCVPYTPSTPSSTPASIIVLEPLPPSSAGWNTRRTSPRSSSVRRASQARGAKQHGDVAVVAAGVHAASLSEQNGSAGLLGDGKRVDVGAQHEAAARSAVLKVGVRRAPAQRGDDAGGGGTFVGNAQGVQVRADLGGGVVLLVGDLGVGVVPAPAVDDVVARLACRRTNRVRRLCHVAAPSLASSNLSQGSTPAVAVVPGPTATVADARGAHGETVW